MASKPNVLVFFTDQQRWDSSGLFGNPLDLMPNFDRLAQAGTHLYHSYTCQPVCGPARACLQTGKYASALKVPTNGIRLPLDEKTLAHHFKDAGYATGYIGKWHLGSPGNPGPVAEEERGGYEYWLGSNVLEFTSEAYHTVMYDNDNNAVFTPGYRVDAVADRTIQYIAGHKDEPFFLFTSYIEPHFQNRIDDYPPPDGYRQRYMSRFIPPDLMALGGSTHQHIAGYWGMIKRLDEALGRVYDALKSLNILDNTIILFTTDHGNHFKTRNSEYKRSCHDSSIRLPTMFTGPGFNGGGRVDAMTSIVDLMPTLLDAAGLDVPDGISGRSILPLLRKEAVDWPDDIFVQISESQCGRALRTHRWKYSVVAPDAPSNALGADRYVEEYLYDMEADPYELRNLVGIDAYRPVADRLKERLVARMVAIGEPEPVIENAPAVPSGQRRLFPEEINM